MATFCYVWELLVHPGHVEAFEAAYGPEGEWVQLFRQDASYLGTDLLRDCHNPGRFLTIDRWATEEACLAFRVRFQSELAELDARCGRYTVEERHLGDFDV